MGAVLLRRRLRRRRFPALGRERLRPAAHTECMRAAEYSTRSAGALSLDDVIGWAWEGLSVREMVSCPICGGEMMDRREATATCVGVPGDAPCGVCGGCGAQLS